MTYDDYSSDLKKTENLINYVKRFIIELELNEGYAFASDARDELARLEKELEKLKSY